MNTEVKNLKLNYVVKIILRKDKQKKDGTCPLYLIVKLNGKVFVKLSTGEKGKKEHWNSKSQSFVGKGYGVRENSRIRTIILEVEDYIKEEKLQGNFVTKEMIKRFFKNEDLECYFSYFDNTFTKSKLINLSSSTVKKYLLLRKRLKEFSPSLRLCEINYNFLNSFHNYLTQDKKIGKGGVWNLEKNLRATVIFANKLNLMNDNPFNNFKLNKLKSKNEHLTIEELNKIVDVDLKGINRLEKIRDMFLFSCYTGLRFGDTVKLKWENIQKGIINITQEKTKNPVAIPLNTEAKSIYVKIIRNKRNRKTVFKTVSNQKTNYALKNIAELAEVDKKISFHLARHTFGTILGKNQNAFTVMKLMGHKKISTSAIYVNTDVNGLKDVMSNVKFRI